MKTKFGNVFLVEDYREIEDCPESEDGIFIAYGTTPNPEEVWPDDARMKVYIDRNHNALKGLGILNEEAYIALNNLHIPVKIVTEFKDLELAKRVFLGAIEKHVLDIYLFHNGQIIDSYD